MPFGFIAAGIGLGLSLLEGASGASQQRDLAQRTQQSILEEMDLLRGQRSKLEELYKQKQTLTTDTYGNKVQNLVDLVGVDLENATMQGQQMTGQTGLAYSGTVTGNVNRRKREQFSEFKGTSQTLYSKYREDLLDIQASKERELGDIETRLAGLRGQYDIAEQQSKTKFLGLF